jgi:hypothetical protein
MCVEFTIACSGIDSTFCAESVGNGLITNLSDHQLVASRLLAVLYMHISLWCVRITYCRGQTCRRPATYNFPTLAAIKLRVLVDSKGGAASLVRFSVAVRDLQRLLALVLVVAGLATVEALHGILRPLGRL